MTEKNFANEPRFSLKGTQQNARKKTADELHKEAMRVLSDN